MNWRYIPAPLARPWPRTAIPDAGQVEQFLHDLRVSEPAMLTRAQLADAAALDLITEATQAASRRHTINDPSLGTWQHRTSGQ
jgi:hypothetical protein